MDILSQTLWITVIGVGLTFVAIGLLVATMIGLTRWTRGRARSVHHREVPAGAIPGDEELEEVEQAAAVAVALALALAGRRAHPVRAWHAARGEEEPSAWQAYARSQHLDQRKTHQTLRW
jgi:Na+-transporting methylmalonyl-CoA/oxaloacetate decarboxylase gamma subunit